LNSTVAEIGRRAWHVYRLVIVLIAVACVVQFYLAGRGVFGIHGDAKLGDQSSFDAHRTLGNAIAIATLVAFALALVIWDKRLVVATLVLAVLAEVVQHATATAGSSWVAGLHALSGLAILGISGSLAHRAWRHRGAAEQAA
jgi:hypothetical protein